MHGRRDLEAGERFVALIDFLSYIVSYVPDKKMHAGAFYDLSGI
jgi:hypothetical protein